MPGCNISIIKTRKILNNNAPIKLTVSIRFFFGNDAPSGISANEMTLASADSIP